MTSAKEKHVQLPSESSSPGTSRNQQTLTAGMLVTEGDNSNEDGDCEDRGECDRDIFDILYNVRDKN